MRVIVGGIRGGVPLQPSPVCRHGDCVFEEIFPEIQIFDVDRGFANKPLQQLILRKVLVPADAGPHPLHVAVLCTGFRTGRQDFNDDVFQPILLL